MKRPSERQVLASEGLAAGKSVTEAMRAAGYSPSTVDQGIRAVPATVQALGIKALPLYQAGKGLSIGDLEKLALGRLAQNVVEGKDAGTLTAKVIGSHKALNLWIAENQTGVIVINTPQVEKLLELPDKDE